MSERFRKRLEHIDQAGPSDEVIERAHRGPQLPDDPTERPATGARIVTAVAAFTVFALAIGVFAIPILRLRQSVGDVGGPSSLRPLWPVRSFEDVERAQALARDGDVTTAFLLDPTQTALEFGRHIMGWDGAFAEERSGEGLFGCGSFTESASAGAGDDPSGSSVAAGSALPSAEFACANGWFGYSPVDSSSSPGANPYAYPSVSPSGGPTGSPTVFQWGRPDSSPGTPSAGTATPFRTFRIYPCDPSYWRVGAESMACSNLPHALTRDGWNRRMPPVEIVTLFQPLGAGTNNVWMVMSIRSPLVDLPVTSGAVVPPGPLEVRSDVPASYASAGFVVDQVGDCPGSGGGGAPIPEPRELDVFVSLFDSTRECPPQAPGYIYFVGLERAGSGSDPLSRSGGYQFVALAAVPVTFVVPEKQPPSQNGTLVRSTESPPPPTRDSEGSAAHT